LKRWGKKERKKENGKKKKKEKEETATSFTYCTQLDRPEGRLEGEKGGATVVEYLQPLFNGGEGKPKKGRRKEGKKKKEEGDS